MAARAVHPHRAGRPGTAAWPRLAFPSLRGVPKAEAPGRTPCQADRPEFQACTMIRKLHGMILIVIADRNRVRPGRRHRLESCAHILTMARDGLDHLFDGEDRRNSRP
jgi:hypothetical protein